MKMFPHKHGCIQTNHQKGGGGGQPNMQVAPKTNKRQTHKGKTSKNMAKSLDLSKQAQI